MTPWQSQIEFEKFYKVTNVKESTRKAGKLVSYTEKLAAEEHSSVIFYYFLQCNPSGLQFKKKKKVSLFYYHLYTLHCNYINRPILHILQVTKWKT